LAVRGGGRHGWRVGGSVEDEQRLVIVDDDVPPEVRLAVEVGRDGLIVEGAGSHVTRLMALRPVRRIALSGGAAALAGVV
jgi:hypothetical protein